MQYFCTLFDSNFLSRGLALYESLKCHAGSFKLYVYCFDDLTFDVLQELALPEVTPVALRDFEGEDLLRIKASRSAGEYCWTCTPHIIRHALAEFRLPCITYLDADLYFFSSPLSLFAELDAVGASVLITEHRYTPKYDHSLLYGIYCVQFMTFSADQAGLEALNWWADRCLEWCYARAEEGKFGDQKYLDDWLQRFNGVHVLRHLGGGVAPWNTQQYEVSTIDGNTLELCELATSERCSLVFYHFHGLQVFHDGEIDLATYPLPISVRKLVYHPYLDALRRAASRLSEIRPGVNFHGLRSRPSGVLEHLRTFKRRMARRLSGALNVLPIRDLIQLR